MRSVEGFPIKKYYQVIFVFFPACNDADDIGTPTLLRKKRLFMKIPPSIVLLNK